MSVSPRPRLILVSTDAPGPVQAGRVAPEVGVELHPGSEVILGRGPGSDLPLDGAAVSKRHARVWLSDGRVLVEDLGSTNGTYINGQPVEGHAVLEHGGVLGLGEPFVAPQRGALILRDRARDLIEEMQLFEFAPEGELIDETVAADDGVLEAVGPKDAAGDDPLRLLVSDAVDESAASENEARREAREPELAAAAEVEGATVVGASSLRRLRPVLIGAGIAFVTLVLLVLVLWDNGGSAGWRDVRLVPSAGRSGTAMTVSSGDIRSDQPYEVRIDDTSVQGLVVEDGRLQLTVPRLEGLASGEQPVPLVVTLGSRTLMSTSIVYEARPEILSLSPHQVRVGDPVTIEGIGFRDVKDVREGGEASLARFVVLVGDQVAEVLSASTTSVVFRMPLVTRRKQIDVPISLVLDGGAPLEAREALTVAPRILEPLTFSFVPSYEPGLEAWQISSPLGVAFYLKQPEAAASSGSSVTVPVRVSAACENFERLFREAPDDGELRVIVAARGDGYALERVDQSGKREILVEFNQEDLATTALGGGTQVPPHILTFWQATVWNYMLDTFARGLAPEAGPTAPAYLRSLARLVDNNRAQSGYGRPEQRDLDDLPEINRAILSSILFEPPAGFGDLSGTWKLVMANVFYPTDDIDVSLTLKVRHVAADLTGTAQLEFKDDFAYVRTFEAPLRGQVEAGSPPELAIEARFEEPIGLVVLQGTAAGWELGGTFKAGGRRAGEWYGTRESGDRP